MALVDSFGRSIQYLRVSVTERCNFRCHYCRPAQGGAPIPREELLSLEELARLLDIFVGLGVRRVRLTGGEPLLRRNLLHLIRSIRPLAGLEEISLSTNGYLLGAMAHDLAAAGVERVNSSLDSLNPATFADLTRGGDLDRVLAGIDGALAAGLHPVKVNMVVMGGINDHEIPAMVDFAWERGVRLRFIETMPVGEVGGRAVQRYVSAGEILERIRQHRGVALIPEDHPSLTGPARLFRLEGSEARVGIISAMSRHFCSDCNRMRLTSRGDMVLCLGREDRVDLRCALRAGADDAQLADLIRRGVAAKPEGHGFRPPRPEAESSGAAVGHRMSALGG